MLQRLTIGFSTHRPETLPFAGPLMVRHSLVILEDPPTPGFRRMLRSQMSISDYALNAETDYPAFNEASCKLARQLHRQGIQVVQIEPFMELLIEIHELFAAGGSFRDINPSSLRFQVYQAEKRATEQLIKFYQASVSQDFESVVAAVKRFAKTDANRFRLRDTLRAQAIANCTQTAESAYIEAGEMHQGLVSELKARLKPDVKVTPCFLMAPIIQALTGKKQVLAPGDQITLHYIRGQTVPEQVNNLLAGRSLIYNKIIEKNEIATHQIDYPHQRDELRMIARVNLLDWSSCKEVFDKIRRVKTIAAQALVDQALIRRGLGSRLTAIDNQYARPIDKSQLARSHS